MNNLKRVYILGTSGSGKSFLANRLSEKLGINCYDLDDIYWIKKYTVKRDAGKRKKLLKKIASKKSWIIEGVYDSWVDEALKKSDIVILLDIHIARLTWRILLRYFKRVGGERGSIKDTIALIKYAHRYKNEGQNAGFRRHRALIKKHKSNYIILKNNKQIKNFLDKI